MRGSQNRSGDPSLAPYAALFEDGVHTRDVAGEELSGAEEARRSAIRIMSEILNGHVSDLLPEGRLEVKVLDAGRKPIFSVVASTATR